MLDSASCGQIDLATEPAFCIGDLSIDPARLQVVRGDRSARLEARVMQVLVVLGRADAQVVSRAELVERCWDGRIVGENAIQRVISRLRHLATTLGGFELETVVKVGYVLRAKAGEVLPPAPPPPPPTPPPTPVTARPETSPAEAGAVSRRHLVWVTGALAVGGTALLAWRSAAPPSPDAEAARRLVAKAGEAELAGQPEANTQAIAYLKRATELDPGSALAWGSLALAYRSRMEQSGDAALSELADQVRSAATRALAIDPKNASARLALAAIPSNFGHWAANERVLLGLQSGGIKDPALDSILGGLICDTGRWQDAIACYRRALAAEPFHPMNRLTLAWALSGYGKLAEADALFETALRLWPTNPIAWQSRFDFLAMTGRAAAAVTLLDDRSLRPVIAPDWSPPPYATMRDFALAMQAVHAGNVQPDAPGLASRIFAERSALGLYTTVTFLCSLGQIDPAFGVLESYFFGGAGRPPPGPLCRRRTSVLFLTKAAPLRRDPRFADLLRRTGLEAYWRQTGTRPDPWLLAAQR